MVLYLGEWKVGPQIGISVEASLHCFQSWCSVVWWSSSQNKESFINIFHVLGGLVLQKSSKIFFEEGPGPCPQTALLSLDSSPSLHPLPSLISNPLNLPLGSQGRSWRLNEAHLLRTKNEGHRKAQRYYYVYSLRRNQTLAPNCTIVSVPLQSLQPSLP